MGDTNKDVITVRIEGFCVLCSKDYIPWKCVLQPHKDKITAQRLQWLLQVKLQTLMNRTKEQIALVFLVWIKMFILQVVLHGKWSLKWKWVFTNVSWEESSRTAQNVSPLSILWHAWNLQFCSGSECWADWLNDKSNGMTVSSCIGGLLCTFGNCSVLDSIPVRDHGHISFSVTA